VKWLASHSTQEAKEEALWHAAWDGHLAVVQRLLQGFIYNQEVKDQALEIAASGGQLDVVEFLLFYATQPGIDNALKRAASNGHEATTQFL